MWLGGGIFFVCVGFFLVLFFRKNNQMNLKGNKTLWSYFKLFILSSHRLLQQTDWPQLIM